MGCNAGSSPPGTATITIGSQTQTVTLSPSAPVSASSVGTATFTLPVGTYALSASYSGGGGAGGVSSCSSGNATGTSQVVDTPPTVTINQSAAQQDPTAASPVTFDVVFDKPVTGFTSSDVQLGGSANPTGASVSGSGATYTVSVTGMSQSGSVTASIPAGVAQSSAGFPNDASTSTDNQVSFVALSISTTSLPDATYNAFYSEGIVTIGGSNQNTFALAGGSLPTGVSLGSSGLVSGTPTSAGTYNFTVSVTDTINSVTVTGPVTLTVPAPTIVLDPATLPPGTVAAAYNATMTASGGATPYTFSVAGSPPPGLNLDSSGSWSGQPSTAGDYNFNVTATDAYGATGSNAYSVHVAGVVPQPPTAVTASAGAVGSGQAQISFTPPSDTGGLPITGYTVASSIGSLSASGGSSPITVAGLVAGTSYAFTVTATNSAGTSTASAPSNSVTVLDAQTIIFSNPGTQTFGSTPTLVATASSDLSVSFSSSTVGVCTITGDGTLTFFSAGTCTIGADQAGNSAFAPAPQVVQSFTVAAVTPGAPTIGTATAGDQQATVNFIAPASNGGSPIIGYTATSSPGGFTATGSGGSVTITGLSNGVAYTFMVTATNGAGTGPASAASNSVTPRGSQVIAFANPGTQDFGVSPQLNATASSGLPVVFTSATTSVCTVTTVGVLTPISPGTCTINANQAGDGTWLPAAQVSQSFNIVVPSGAVLITTPSPLPPAAGGTAYATTINVAGGFQPYVFSLAGGSLPPGLVFASSGSLSGIPTSAGTYTFTLHVADAATQTADKSYQLVVNAPAIAITPATLPNVQAGTAYPSTTLAASGGTAPYAYAITAGTLPAGLSLSPAGNISGTPTAAGTFSIAVTATDAFGFTGSANYSVTVASPAISLSPASLPSGTAGTAYSQPVTADGGIAPYTYNQAGPLPAGLIFDSATGAFSGTPTQSGSFNLSVSATDSTTGIPASITQAYTLVITAPNVSIAPATLPAGTVGDAYRQTISASGGISPYSYAQSGTLPPGLTFDTTSGDLAGTPTSAGSFNFSITATDSTTGTAGTSMTSYTVAVGQAAPVASDDTAQTVGGQAVVIPVTANDTGVITSVTVSAAPAHGTATVSGTSITYTPAATFSGADAFEYTGIGPGGASPPARVTITVDPLPIPQSQSVSTAAGSPVTVDLAKDAVGGPFTGATIVSVTPSTAGTWSLAGEQLTFTSKPDFDGAVNMRFTLTNAYATSAEATLTITVEAKPDPTLDPEVMGILQAQTDAARRFATSQIANFQDRLEHLHQEDNSQPIEEGLGFANGVMLNFAPTCTLAEQAATDENCGRRPTLDDSGPFKTPLDDPASAPVRGHRSRLTIWTGGSITVGERDSGDGLEFQTTGLSGGLDYRINRDLTLGIGVGYGHDDTDIGDNGSRSRGNAYTAAVYGSYHPGDVFFVDGIAGYQRLSFDSHRYVTADGGFVDGKRDGDQLFASISAGAKLQFDQLRVTPYGRFDVAHGKLDPYTESGGSAFALHYGEQDVDTATGNIGVTLAYKQPVSFGVISPRLRLEYQHDFQGDSSVTMNYADVFSGPSYEAFVDGLGRDRFQFGLGLDIETVQDFSLGFEYRGLSDGKGKVDQGFSINAAKHF
jgi:uncharacterized protein YhjY with autotransporter beta-barrel domain